MFSGCNSLKSIDLSNLDSSKVIDMQYMFKDCTSLKSINLFNLDISQLINIEGIFYGCSSLITIDLSNFDTSKVTNMEAMFYGCSSLISIDLSNFDTSKVTDMREMFYGCSSLISIDLSNFDTSKVIFMENMFSECISLISIDISNCDLYYSMFSDISSIRYINIYNLKNDKIISETFMYIAHPIFVCQKNKIIDNLNAYNCCDSNFRVYECTSPSYIPTTTDNSTPYYDDPIYIDYKKIKSSSSISTGVIIGIIAAGVVVIASIIIIICYKFGCLCKNCSCPWKKKPISTPLPSPENQFQSSTTINNINNSVIIQNNNKNETAIIEYEPQNDKDNPIKIIFVNQTLGNTNILIDSKKTIDELIKFYFEKNRKINLYGDKNILFLIGGRNISPPYPKDPIETLISKVVNSKTIRIIVQDTNEKMKNTNK